MAGAFEIIEDIFEGKKAEIKNINENSIALVLNISSPGGRIKQVEIVLNKKKIP